jgi:antitoxin component YwqK of YwqJK toxin-antitoxin module
VKKFLGTICFLVLSFVNCLGQTLGAETHPFKQVYDSVYGIQFYDKYSPMLGGDSVRKYSGGHLCNGLIEDHYPDGTLLHKGFYTDGKLTQYTNYYPGGQVERVFKPTSDRKNELKKYFSNKVLKSDVVFYEGNTTLWQDYYENGQLSYLEEYGKDHERVLRRCSYYRDGKPASIFQPLEIKGALIRYSLKEYFPNGQLQEESEALYNKDSYDFLKDGDDKIYDDKGNLINEYDYVGGKINSTIK